MFKTTLPFRIIFPLLFLVFFTSCVKTDSDIAASDILDHPFNDGKYDITTMTTANTINYDQKVTPEPQQLFEGIIEFSDTNFNVKGKSYLKWPWQEEMKPQEVKEKGIVKFAGGKTFITFTGDAPEPGFTMSGTYKVFVFDNKEEAQKKLAGLPDNIQYTWLEGKDSKLNFLLIKTFFTEKMGL